jgi:hypothetical protein
MRDGVLEAKLERAEETYEDLVRTRASLGTALAEAIKRGRDLSEFGGGWRTCPSLFGRRTSGGPNSKSSCCRGD